MYPQIYRPARQPCLCGDLRAPAPGPNVLDLECRPATGNAFQQEMESLAGGHLEEARGESSRPTTPCLFLLVFVL